MATAVGETPAFFLYGEPPRAAAAGFLHLETLDVRTRPSGWTIPMHRHADLNHVFLLTAGAGAILTGEREIGFAAPSLLLIPAGAPHGFTYRRESTGYVLTVASGFIERRPAAGEVLDGLFSAPHPLGCGEAVGPLQAAYATLARELAWQAPGHDAAVEAAVLQIFVLALRLQHQARAAERGGVGRDAALLARFREQVELRFREHPPLETYAETLGVSLSRLHQACRRVGGVTPLGVVQERLLLEAKRSLLYSDMGVAALALDLGFSDPAYFSRFFAKQAGVSARAFRRSGTGA
jgi:AraC family transcriptional regulator, transcriptional activator of pobA